MDFNLFLHGDEFRAYEFFGAHYDGKGTQFRTHAPNAKNVYLAGDFNNYNNQLMENHNGVWELYNSDAKPGQTYKYRIEGPNGRVVEHADPYAFAAELRPKTASIIHDKNDYEFNDDEWMNKRTNGRMEKPMSIYELHLGSWRTKVHELGEYTESGELIQDPEDNWLNYREIAAPLIKHCHEYGFTHVEILPLTEHPLDVSWGYLPTGYFAATSRYGSSADLKYLIDQLHQNDIGVILDFVPVHFPSNEWALANYDGTEYFEYPYADLKYNEWGSLNFNLMKGEVRSFLNSSAAFWAEVYHVDGLRIDAVSNIIYYDGNKNRGENQEGINFIRTFNRGLHQIFPNFITIAEDSSDYPQVTNDVKYGGLGFTYKWDMGWMNDTLEFFSIAPWDRRNHYNMITFSMMYFYSEKFVLPFSHDEVVHGDKTIIDKMYGEYEEKFKQAKSLYLYMFSHPGKKLNFMGNEIGQFREWDETREQDWTLLKLPAHDSFSQYFKAVNQMYVNEPVLYTEEFHDKNFKWTIVDDYLGVVYAYWRGSTKEKIWFIFNFAGEDHQDYQIKLEGHELVEELINTEWEEFGGSVKRPAKGQNDWKEIKAKEDNKNKDDKKLKHAKEEKPVKTYSLHLRPFNSRAFRIRELPKK